MERDKVYIFKIGCPSAVLGHAVINTVFGLISCPQKTRGNQVPFQRTRYPYGPSQEIHQKVCQGPERQLAARGYQDQALLGKNYIFQKNVVKVI